MATENEFRASALWRHLSQCLGAELPFRSRPEVISTRHAFPHTRWTSSSISVVMDQHLIELFQDLTRPMVIPSCPQELAAAHIALVLAERLGLAGRNTTADFFGGIFNDAQRTFRDLTTLDRGAWGQGDLLVRGQWLFALAHELVHSLLYQEDLAVRLEEELSLAEVELLEELRNLSAWAASDDVLKLEPILRFLARTHDFEGQDAEATASQLAEVIALRLSEPRFRREVICDWSAARAAGTEMQRWAPAPIGLASCGLSLISLAIIQQMDSYAGGSSWRSIDSIGESALRLVVLRTLLCVMPTALETTPHLVSRAFGDVTKAFLETYDMALRINWSSAIQEVVDSIGSPNAG